MSTAALVKRWMLRIVLVLVVLAALAFAAMRLASDPVPEGESGPVADALAHRIERAVDIAAWQRTGAVRWDFAGRHHHLWDKARDLHRVTWGDHEVVLRLSTKRGCVREKGRMLTGTDRDRLLTSAYAYWINDSFWLNPLGKLFDPGVVRKRVLVSGRDALLVTFTQNGLTPGDSYLWLLDATGRPVAWRMWTKIPIGGLKASWEEWKRLETGAWVATRHRMRAFDLRLTNVAGAASLTELLGGGPDPFDWCNVL